MNVLPIPEAHYAKLPSGYRIHYRDDSLGGEGRRPVVVFLHGSGNGACGYSNFKGNIPALVQAGYRVITPDLIGYGYSDKPDNVEYHLDFFVACVQQTLDVIGVDKVTLIGNSLGGAIALGLALAHPQQVERLVLMAPGGLNDLPDYLAMPGMKMMFELFNAGAPVDHARLKAFFQAAFVVDPDVVDDQLVAERCALMKLQNAQVIKTMKVPNLTPRLPEIRQPALALWGLNERMMPESGILRLAKGLPNCRMVLVPNCGHWVMIEHRALFNRLVLDFLENG
ncbi:4,5:9,10-diseco-3-hydroxy-5,9,17-trioxoandrosta-1(10),2-diene-4-oate hydrolase [Fontimonas thermophila]|uniref:4,5:9,10-diseco-3-hydroxy-5,9,17-trioxoandrosta-1(10),2-diene-4-oate hydrolase n=1 Tax=Fontimonas thermophila TaxID=1076937 RepID=A0A1I2HAP0_9GAMM|nr:alpha/beta hydrolase [Fontimonas thermophila]SFF26579.1 4,5:9,10-diseco-3-hydroxy-5,9,17-trioxoandrosta-1(10),2-diene-4-oate hydrolase [Fontimonas thermophila]